MFAKNKQISYPENGQRGHGSACHQGWAPLSAKQTLGLHGGRDFHASVGGQLGEARVNLGGHDGELDHLGDGDDVAEHGWVHVDGGRVEEVGVEVLVADETAEPDARVLGDALDGDRDSECHREDPAEGCEPGIVAIDKVYSPDSQLLRIDMLTDGQLGDKYSLSNHVYEGLCGYMSC